MRPLIPPPRAVRFVVLGEPHAWERARLAGKRLFTSDTMAAQMTAVRRAARAIHLQPPPEPMPMGLDVVGMWLFPRSMREATVDGELMRLRDEPLRIGIAKMTKPDVDNIGKLVADALNPTPAQKEARDFAGCAYLDDGCLWQVRFTTVWGPRNETHVRVWYGDEAPNFPERWW